MAFLTSLIIGGMVANTVMNARAQYKAGKEQGRVADQNAAIAEDQAIDAQRRGEEEGMSFRRQVRSLIGTQRAGYSGQNVDVNVGSAAQVRRSTEQLAESDLARIRRNAEREAMGFKVMAEDYRQQGKYARAAGRNATLGTIIGGATEATSLLAVRQGWGQPKPPK